MVTYAVYLMQDGYLCSIILTATSISSRSPCYLWVLCRGQLMLDSKTPHDH